MKYSIPRKPGILERYIELLYRRKIRRLITISRMSNMLSKDDYKLYVKEEHMCHITNSVTFFVLGIITCQIIRLILHYR